MLFSDMFSLLRAAGIDEYGNPGSPVPRFTDNRDCQSAFKAYMCYINFPRLDARKDQLTTELGQSGCLRHRTLAPKDAGLRGVGEL